MEEEYRVIKGFDNYSVSNFGNVRNNLTGKVLKPGLCTNGYELISLCKDGKKKTYRIHKIVGNIFLDNPHNKRCIDHKDGNKRNNNVNNLRWTTHSENNINQKLNIKNKSNFKGVCFYKQSNKWKAYIKNHFIGYFDNIEDAIAARVKKSTELFGEYQNKCEKEINININIPASTKVNLNINIKSKEEQELEDLEKEFNEILNKK